MHAGPIPMVVGEAWNSHQKRHEAQGAQTVKGLSQARGMVARRPG